MNFAEYWNKGKIYQHDAQLPECKNCEGVAAEYAWNDCKEEILLLIENFEKQSIEISSDKGFDKDLSYQFYLLREKIKKEI